MHTHANAKSEGLSTAMSTLKGGGELLDVYVAGSGTMTSCSNQVVSRQVPFTIIDVPDEYHLAYPLYGQNVIDWRMGMRGHNNVPPTLNIFAKVLGEVDNIVGRTMTRGGDVEDEDKAPNASEMQYQSEPISHLDDYQEDDLTIHDCILRMTLDGSSNGEVNLMKQSLQDFLDIFGNLGSWRLGIGKYSMQDLLKSKLDEELILRSEFMTWFYEQEAHLGELANKIQEIRELAESAPPLNYVGRIVISTTDDVEAKVIKNYGGKHWKRVVNFLRGVDADSPDLGKKFGEEYVCLRESDIPFHTHTYVKTTDETLDGLEWVAKGVGGRQTKLVNHAIESITESMEPAPGIESQGILYHMGPLDYEPRQYITIPHDNMPPYKEVYIWECVEVTDEEAATIQSIIPSL